MLLRAGFSLVAASGGHSSLKCARFSLGGFFCCRARALGTRASGVVVLGLSSCGTRAELLLGMWELPGPGLEPVSPALAGGFLTTVPPGTSQTYDSLTLCELHPALPCSKSPPVAFAFQKNGRSRPTAPRQTDPVTGLPDASSHCLEIMQEEDERKTFTILILIIYASLRAPHIKSFPIPEGDGSTVLQALACCVFPSAWQKNKTISLFLQNLCLRISVRQWCTGKLIFRQHHHPSALALKAS